MYTRQFSPTPPLPPIGFTADVVNGSRPMSSRSSGRPMSAGMGRWDDKRDLTFMRVLSAEEFLGRMFETDEQITSWTNCDMENQVKFVKIKELLGLRGHLQDELLRIEAMLAADDPQLRCLREFEAEFPHVVRQLRELNQKSQAIQIESTDIGLDFDDAPSSSTMGTQTTSSQGHSTGTQSTSQGQGSQGVAVGADDGELDPELRRKFIAEEDHVSGNYASRFANNSRPLDQSDINALLNEHAVSMQALRKKQDMERTKHKDWLEAKKRGKMLGRRQEQQRDFPNGGNRSKKGEFFVVDFATPTPGGIQKKTPSAPKRTSFGAQWFYIDMDGNTVDPKSGTSKINQLEPLPRQGTVTKDLSESIERQGTFTMDAGKPVGMATRIPSAKSLDNNKVVVPPIGKNTVGEEHRDRSNSSDKEESDVSEEYEDDFEDENDEKEKEDLKMTLTDDLWGTLNKEDGTSKEEFQELLKTYRDQKEGRQVLKDAADLKHKSSFLAKLAERQKKKGSDPNEIQTQTDGSGTSSMATGTDDPFEKELEAIREKDGDLVNNLMRERHKMSDADFQKLLNQHLSDTERLRNQRAHDQERLRQKLREKLKNKRSTMGSGSCSGSEDEADDLTALDLDEADKNDKELQRELTELDEKLQKELKKRGKNIDESDLTELLEHYRRQQAALLKQRGGERRLINDKLQKKLAEKSKKSRAGTDKNDDDDSAIREKDIELLKKLLAERHKLSDADFQKLLEQHLADVDRLRTRKARDQDRLREKLREKIRNRQAAKKADGLGSNDSDGETPSVLDLDEAEANDKQILRELTELDEKLQKELKKRGKNIDESDLTELLEHYRRQQAALLKQRRGERRLINDKLHKKLAEKSKKSRDGTDKNDDDDSDREEKDASVYQELIRLQKRGELTEDMFNAKMKEYLDQVDRDKQATKQKRRQEKKQRAALDRDAASILVHEHQARTQQIKGIRQREKDIMDQKLQKKLMAKKNKGAKKS